MDSNNDKTSFTAKEWTPEKKRGKAHGVEVQLGQCPECHAYMVIPSGQCLRCRHSSKMIIRNPNPPSPFRR